MRHSQPAAYMHWTVLGPEYGLTAANMYCQGQLHVPAVRALDL